MTQIYYRLIPENRGKHTLFVPEFSYEQIRYENGKFSIIENPSESEKINEICFSKSIIGSLFAISMMMSKPRIYYIYKTCNEEKPDIDLSRCPFLDFEATEEVRFRSPVPAVLHGTIFVSEWLIYCLNSTYDQCLTEKGMHAAYFQSEVERFNQIDSEIILVSPFSK